MFASVPNLPTDEQIAIVMEYRRKRQQDELSAKGPEAPARPVYPRMSYASRRPPMNPPGTLTYHHATERVVVQHSARLHAEDSIPTEQPVEEAIITSAWWRPAHCIIA
jgi:hypothetical protein